MDAYHGLDAETQKNVPDTAVWALPPSDKHVKAAIKKSKRVFKHGIPTEAIAYSSSSENMYKEIDIKKLSFKLQFK